MKRSFFLPCVVLLAALFGCDSVDVQTEDALLVVEAFLYAGEPVEDIRITRAVSLSGEDTVAAPVTDATVRLAKGGSAFALSSTGDGGRYGYLEDDLTVEAGDVFLLDVQAAGQQLTAETTVPPPPVGVALTGSVLKVPDIGIGAGFRGMQDSHLTVTWDNAGAALHYIVVESLTADEPVYILPDFIRERFQGFRLVTAPTDANYHDINVRSLQVLGPHRVTVYRVNREYADLYENRQQDSRDLNEPPSNIRGGLGVFSAFNSRSADFEVEFEDG